MSKMKPADLAYVYNNIAKNKHLAPIQPGEKLTLHQIADKIEASNSVPWPQKGKKPPKVKKPRAESKWGKALLKFIKDVHLVKMTRNG